MKIKIQNFKTSRKMYSMKCKKCLRVIRAFSESNLEYNMRLHLETHEKVEK